MNLHRLAQSCRKIHHFSRVMRREKITKIGGIYENRSCQEAKDDRHLF